MSVVKSLFSGPKSPAPLPTPEPTPATPTVDDARVAADAEMQANKRKGRLANYLTNTNTSAQLNQSTGPSLKRMLGA